MVAKNAHLRSLDLRDACIRIKPPHSRSGCISVAERDRMVFSIAPDGEVLVNAAQSALIAGMSASTLMDIRSGSPISTGDGGADGGHR